MMMLGVGEILGGMLVGGIRDAKGYRVAIIVEIILMLAAGALYYILNSATSWSIIGFPMCFMWGIMDAGINCLVNCILGFEFEDKTAPFGVFKFVQSFLNAVFFLVNIPLAKMYHIGPDPNDDK